VIGCKHPVIPMPVPPRRRHEIGSLNALLGVEGFSGGALQGTEQFSLATDGGQYSFTSGLRLATTALAGKSLDKLVLLPDFTYPPTNQAGFSNLVLGDAASTIPEPGTVILLLLGTAGLATLRKKITPQA
jgi:hypothetical protein